MAVDIHTRTLIMVPVVDATGEVLDKNRATIAQMQRATSQQRVDDTSYPTVEEYLNLEAAAGYQFAHLDQTYIITQKIT